MSFVNPEGAAADPAANYLDYTFYVQHKDVSVTLQPGDRLADVARLVGWLVGRVIGWLAGWVVRRLQPCTRAHHAAAGDRRVWARCAAPGPSPPFPSRSRASGARGGSAGWGGRGSKEDSRWLNCPQSVGAGTLSMYVCGNKTPLRPPMHREFPRCDACNPFFSYPHPLASCTTNARRFFRVPVDALYEANRGVLAGQAPDAPMPRERTLLLPDVNVWSHKPSEWLPPRLHDGAGRAIHNPLTAVPAFSDEDGEVNELPATFCCAFCVRAGQARTGAPP